MLLQAVNFTGYRLIRRILLYLYTYLYIFYLRYYFFFGGGGDLPIQLIYSKFTTTAFCHHNKPALSKFDKAK